MMRLHTTKSRLALTALVLLLLSVLLLGPARTWAQVYTWAQSYGGEGWDAADSIQQTSDGGYVVAGETESYGAGGSDFWVLKLNGTALSSGRRPLEGTGGIGPSPFSRPPMAAMR